MVLQWSSRVQCLSAKISMPLPRLWWTLVASHSVSAVLQQGLILLQQQDADIQADRTALQALLQQRANGSFISADQLRTRLAAQPR